MLTGPELGAAIEAARIKKGVSKKVLAEAFGVKPPSIQDWVRHGTIDKAKLPGLWQYFSDVVGPEHWGLTRWTESQHTSGGLEMPPVAQPMSQALFYAGRPSTSARVPVLGTMVMAQPGIYRLEAPSDGAPIGHVDGVTQDAEAFAVRVFGDGMYPAVRHGSCLVVSPGGQCAGGELVLVIKTSGQYMVGEFVAQDDDRLTVAPANGGARETLLAAEVAKVMPVVNVVAGSKWQPA